MEKQMNHETLTEEKWQAIINNDASYDGQFYYAVKTTGIFCRPSCKSRPPKIENVGIFLTTEQSLSADYRPCKRCKPTGHRLPDDEWIALVTEYIDKNYMNNLTLDILAEISHGSPYHLHRTFKRVTSMTPVEYIQQRKIEQAKELLMTTGVAIAGVGLSVGLANTPYFITLFKKKTGYTPASYRQTQIQVIKGALNNE
ncbi:MAG: bifunctional transcriptional activator/DNA repair enzyme AdaA [Paenibacillaceae bacterium]